MQLTPEILQKFTDTTVERLIKEDPGILAVYQCGSTLSPESPLLGGTTDIDVVFIHARTPETEREILRLTDEVHLDIAHHPQDAYLKGRELRIHPWMGPTLNDAKPLYDPRHFLDFTQASVRGMFHRVDFKIQRARTLLDEARQIWMNLLSEGTPPGPQTISRYLKAVEDAVNAIALLEGPPLTERRLLLDFPARAEAVGHPQMPVAVLGLLGAARLEREQIQGWLPLWEQTFAAIPEVSRPAKLHPDRKPYYLRAVAFMLAGETPQAALWPLLTTWTLAAGTLSPGNPAFQPWREAGEQLGLLPEDFGERLTALDVFIDHVLAAINEWESQSAF